MNFKTIIIGFIALLVIIWLYRYFFSDPTETELVSMGSGETTKTLSADKLSGNPGSSDFTYNTWIYIKDWNYKLTEEKVILSRGEIDDDSMSISLAPSANDLNIKMKVIGGTEKYKCVVKNIPLQRWTHLLITNNNRALDTYIDGKLVKTCLLDALPVINGLESLNVCPPNTATGEPGFKGFVAKVRYYSRTLNPREAYELYKEGYSGSLFGNLINKYRLRFSYIKDNQEVGSLEI